MYENSLQESPIRPRNNRSIVPPASNISKTYQKTLLNMLFFPVTMRRNSRTITVTTTTTAATALLVFGMIGAPPLVFADSPHFVGGTTCAVSSFSGSTATLTCTANKIAGLGNVQTVIVTLTADVTSICQNNGGNPPTGQQGPAPVSTSGTFNVRNGAVSPYQQTLTAISNLKCNGQGLSVCWHFSDAFVTVEGVNLPIPGTFKSSNCLV
jgi:hypothetical protein